MPETKVASRHLDIKQSWSKSKASGESVTSSTTLQDDDDFVFTGLKANTKYTLTAHFHVSCNSSGGFKWLFAMPSGASGTGRFSNNQFSPAPVDLTAGHGATASASNLNMIMTATISTGANAGDLKFRWAQNTSNATATQVHEASHMRLTED